MMCLRNVVPILFVLFSLCGRASELPSSPITKQTIEREQQERLQLLEQNTQSVQSLIPSPTIPEPEQAPESQCFEVRNIQFSGNTIYTDDELSQAIDFRAGCIGLNTINEYLRRASNHYLQAGYVTSRAFLVPQNLSSGTLEIEVLEGKIEKILLNGSVVDSLLMAFSNVSDHVLNLRDIEQGLDQINRLSRYNAQIKLLPSTRAGYSIVDIQSNIGSLGSIGGGVNNGGQKSTGEEQVSIDASAENLFNIFDQWTLSSTHSAAFAHSKNSESLYLGVDVPYGYWNIGYRTSYSTYKTEFSNQGFTFDSTGQTNSHDIDIKWLFYRDGVSKSALKTTVSHRREKNFILGTLLEAGSRNLSSLSFALEHSTRLGKGFLTVSPKVSFGTDWFGGEQNLSSNPNFPKAQFLKSTFSGSYTYPVSSNLSFATTLFGQWSNDTLYANERVSIGGEYSVRGFKNTSISGDEGYYWRNDLTYQLGRWPYLGSVTSRLALDTGSIAKDSSDEYERGSMMGSSLGLFTQSQYASSSLSIGVPLAAPSRINHDDYVIYYRITVKI
ncbi:ShlB/FhaC/HecB family hemolysin secretion/activation protein [Vibrio sp. A1-b2]|uniref:ShlB/FhaC/HecB family hemolysin secretion/activation protein n=1 Tax=Vibrio sp. A1-b2 TaxID=2912248 RepID=UPI001F3F23F4|nr:ShlB/FhaC/HecB family hemolysin secretion/activation protein [Vibrio sp. A1-b2]MCF7360841.1 ShlB/FhaC/HecB family hemolysin secretion/activation protein [Vibrio sp. A1-b2]